jgi:ABC-type branched-subunit amino acid transport system substrate-binding protein
MARPTSAEDTYQVGVTGALKGRSAASYAPVVEALRLYIDRVNAAGGVNGKPVNLLIEDDLTLPWKAGANARKFLTEDGAVLMLDASLSMTYATVVAEAKNAGVPLIFAGSVCPKYIYPPAAEDAFSPMPLPRRTTAAPRCRSCTRPLPNRSRSPLLPWPFRSRAWRSILPPAKRRASE